MVEPDGEGFRVKDAFSRAVRLGEGVLASNLLSPAAQDRAIKALRICAGKIRQHRVSEARLIATEACRRAGNGRA
ncbi:MAG: Ppx/GppA family phosphatase, partial [Pseudomonadota bacterium]